MMLLAKPTYFNKEYQWDTGILRNLQKLAIINEICRIPTTQLHTAQWNGMCNAIFQSPTETKTKKKHFAGWPKISYQTNKLNKIS